MEIKRNKIKKIIIPIMIVVISILLELFLSNYRVFTLSNLEKGNHLIDSNSIKIEEKTNDDKTLYDLEVKDINAYAKKISIKYSAQINSAVLLNYEVYDEYNNITKTDGTEMFLKDLDEITINLNSKLKSITINDVDIENIEITGLSYNNNYTFSIYRCLFIFVAIILCWVVYLYRNQTINQLHKITFLIIILVGTLFVFASPKVANQNFDEQVHIYKVYTNSYLNTAVYSDAYYYVSESPGIILPKSKETNNKLNDVLNSDEMTTETYTKKSKFVPYNEIPYLIMSVGVRIGNTLNLPFTVVFSIAKMMNLLSYAFLASFAVKKAISGKKIVFVLALIPTTIYAASHFSLDALVTGGILLSVVMFLSMCKEADKKIEAKEIAVFIFPLMLACLAKAIYAPIILLLLLLPKQKFKDIKQCRIFKIAICFVFLMMMGSFVLPMLSGGIAGDTRGGNTSVTGQLSLILHNPIGFIKVFYNNIYGTINDYLFSYRMYNNYAYIGLPNQVYTMLYIIVMLYTGFVSGKEFDYLKLKQRILILLGVLAIICMIYGSMYLSFTEVGSTVIKGVQARYFIPLIFPLIIVFMPRNKIISIDENQQMIVINYVMILILLASLYASIIKAFCI